MKRYVSVAHSVLLIKDSNFDQAVGAGADPRQKLLCVFPENTVTTQKVLETEDQTKLRISSQRQVIPQSRELKS